MCRFVIGEKVKHTLTGECFTLMKITGSVFTCKINTPYKSNGVLIDVALINIKNLEVCKEKI